MLWHSVSNAHVIGTLVHNLAKIFKNHPLLTQENPLLSCCCDDPFPTQMKQDEETTLLNRTKTFRFRCSVKVAFASSLWACRGQGTARRTHPFGVVHCLQDGEVQHLQWGQDIFIVSHMVSKIVWENQEGHDRNCWCNLMLQDYIRVYLLVERKIWNSCFKCIFYNMHPEPKSQLVLQRILGPL